jgi:micrococcal nuclease
MDDKLYWYRAQVTRVVDGDTIKVLADLGLETFQRLTLRFHGVNTPEIYGVPKDSDEYAAGMKAKLRVEELISGKQVWIRTYKDRTGKYGRYLAEVFFQDEEGRHTSVTKLLLEDGLGTAPD